jgi:hypothetical protein
MALSDRIRAGSEAAPWVIAEVVALEARMARLEEELREIEKEAGHGIPFYAYGDSEAGCDLAHRLTSIFNRAEAALAEGGEAEK